MSQLVFISLFLGLVAGPQPVELRATADIKSVAIRLGQRQIATLTQPPWKLTIDFGQSIDPRRLTAIGFDSRGNEVARTSQLIDWPRPPAEVEIVLEHKNDVPVAVTLVAKHRMLVALRKAVVTFDGKKLAVNGLRAKLPPIAPDTPHVIEATVTYADRTVARREVVLQAGFSDSTGTEMTPVAVEQTSATRQASLEGCFSADGESLRVGAVEDGEAMVAIVKDPDATEASEVITAMRRLLAGRAEAKLFREETGLPERTFARIVWPIADTVNDKGLESFLFQNSTLTEATGDTLIRLLTAPLRPTPADEWPRQFADAIAVAAVQAIAAPRRRAVVYVVSDTHDESVYSPAAVRHYLDTIGVPFFVWSLRGPRPDLLAWWGPVDDISSRQGLRLAIERLRQTLARQRIVWLAAEPVTALSASVKSDCGVRPLAHIE